MGGKEWRVSFYHTKVFLPAAERVGDTRFLLSLTASGDA